MSHSLTSLAAHFAEIALKQHEMEHRALEKVGRIVRNRAKAEIGRYQDEKSPFAAWADLQESTKADRARSGFDEDKPLLRTGKLRDSIEFTVSDGTVTIGSNEDVAVYQELGTKNIPPRSYLGGAVVDELAEIKSIIGNDVTASLIGEGVFNRRMKITED